MAKRRIGIIAFLLCCVCLMPLCVVGAVSTTDATNQISTQEECTLTIYYGYNGTHFSNVTVKLYKIANVSADFQYELAEQFTDTSLVLNGIRTTEEWNVIRSTLEAHITADGIEPDAILETDQNGRVCFESLETGLYLAISGKISQDDLHYDCDSVLVSLPNLNSDGVWNYRVDVSAKAELLPPADPDDELEFKVLKLWKDDKESLERPNSFEVEIFRDGVSYETITLSESNYWSYSWTTKDDGADWMVVERNIPDGYTMTLEQRGTTFVLTNTSSSEDLDVPKTGDTSNILLYVILMFISGSMLVVLGLTGKRKSV